MVGAGLIGSHVVDAVASLGMPVTAVTRSQPHALAAHLLRSTETVVADVTRTDLDPLLDGVSDVVWALGGLMPGEAEKDPELDRAAVLDPLDHVLAAVRRHPTVMLTVVTSGGTAYGDTGVFPTPESEPARPVNHYGRTRVEVERRAAASADESGHGVRILRVANVYGPGQTSGRGQGFLGYALESALTHRPFTIFGDGSDVRDFVLVTDVAEAVARLMSVEGGPRVLNVASGQPVTLAEALAAVRDVSKSDLTVVHAKSRGFDLPRVELDISLLTALIDYRPTELRHGLELAWQWLTSTSRTATADVAGLGAS